MTSTTFKDIPTTANTHVTLDIPTSITSISPMQVDLNGDGTSDFTLTPKQNDIVTIDTTPPTTTVLLAGTKGKNNWYTTDVMATFNATDTDSGVKSISFSIDGGATTTFPIPPGQSSASMRVTSEGSHIVTFYSEDNAGNRETPQSIAFRIDKVAPEAKLTFDPVSQTLSVIGTDNLSTTTVQTTATSSTITDQAGHTLQIGFTQPKAKTRRIALSITKLIYDDVATSTTATVKYKWNTNTNSIYKMFAAFLSAKTSSLEAHFRPKKNITILTLPPTDLDDSDNDDSSDTRLVKLALPGMVVPYLGTNKGGMFIGY